MQISRKIYFLFATVALLGIGCNQEDAPVVDVFEPAFGPAETLITVQGDNFVDLMAIQFDEGVDADFNPSFGKEDALLFRVPEGAVVGDNMITITSEHGETSFPFRVTLDAPSVFDFNPKSANEGGLVSITGKNFFEPLEVLFFDSIPGEIVYRQEDSLVVEVPAGVERGRIVVRANGGRSITPELFFSTEELLVNDFDGNGVRSETDKWLFYGGIEQNATNAVTATAPEAIDGNFLKLSGFDTGGIWVGGTESHSFDIQEFDVFDISTDVNGTFVELDVNNGGQGDTHLIIVLAERNGSFNDFSETVAIDWDGWESVRIPLNRFSDITGATPDPQKIRTVKLHLYNELNSSQKMEANVDNLKFIQIL
jgi:hypothetical protein